MISFAFEAEAVPNLSEELYTRIAIGLSSAVTSAVPNSTNRRINKLRMMSRVLIAWERQQRSKEVERRKEIEIKKDQTEQVVEW